jgi:hypothetical protein
MDNNGMEEAVYQMVMVLKSKGEIPLHLTVAKVRWRPTATRDIEAQAIMSDGSIATLTITPPLAS